MQSNHSCRNERKWQLLLILITIVLRTRKIEKRSHFWLQKKLDLCIISMRPPPRWAKWSRGVRTRGLRVGLVGGPRPLFLCASHNHTASAAMLARYALTFKQTGIIYGTDERDSGLVSK